MDAEHRLVAETCLRAAIDGSLSFPQIVGRLIAAGFEGYSVDYRTWSQSYYLGAGSAVTLVMPGAMPGPMPGEGGQIGPAFDPSEMARLVRWAQADAADYSYAAFNAKAMQAGCAGYIVSFPGHRVVYFGRSAETHVEHFPQ